MGDWVTPLITAGGSMPGSGSLEQDGPFGIVAMEKEKQADLVHDLGLRDLRIINYPG